MTLWYNWYKTYNKTKNITFLTCAYYSPSVEIATMQVDQLKVLSLNIPRLDMTKSAMMESPTMAGYNFTNKGTPVSKT